MIGHDVQSMIVEFQGEARSLMIDAATVDLPGDGATLDPDTGILTPAAGTRLYEGPCRLRQPTAQESEVLFGDEQLTRSRFVACFPHDAVGFAIGAVVTITASADPDVLDRRYQIMGIPLATFTLYKGYPCEVVE